MLPQKDHILVAYKVSVCEKKNWEKILLAVEKKET